MIFRSVLRLSSLVLPILLLTGCAPLAQSSIPAQPATVEAQGDLSSVKFTTDGSQILLTFSSVVFPASSVQTYDCSSIFDSATRAHFAEETVCQVSRGSVQVLLTGEETLVIGDTMTVVPQALTDGTHLVQGSMAIQPFEKYFEQPQTPFLRLKALSYPGCYMGPLNVVAELQGGSLGRNLTHVQWSLLSSAGVNATLVKAALAAMSSSKALSAALHPDDLGMDRTAGMSLTLQVNVSNYLGGNGSDVAFFSIGSSSDHQPTLSLDILAPSSTPRTERLVLEAVPSFFSCASLASPANTTYTWTSHPLLPGDSYEGAEHGVLSIPAYGLMSGTSYSFSVSASATTVDGHPLTAVASTHVYIPLSTPVTLINGMHRFSSVLQGNTSFTWNFDDTFIPDCLRNASGVPFDLCNPGHTTFNMAQHNPPPYDGPITGICSSEDNDLAARRLEVSASFPIPAWNSGQMATVCGSIQAENGGAATPASPVAYGNVLSSPYDHLEVAMKTTGEVYAEGTPMVDVGRGIGLTAFVTSVNATPPFSYSWSIVSPQGLSTSDPHHFSANMSLGTLAIKPFILSHGQYLEVKVNVTDVRGVSGYFHTGLPVVDSPHGGSFDCTPDTGEAMHSIFTCSFSGWISRNQPLYSVGYIVQSPPFPASRLMVVDNSYSPSISFRLPFFFNQSTTIVPFGIVRDSVYRGTSSYASVSSSIIINPPSSLPTPYNLSTFLDSALVFFAAGDKLAAAMYFQSLISLWADAVFLNPESAQSLRSQALDVVSTMYQSSSADLDMLEWAVYHLSTLTSGPPTTSNETRKILSIAETLALGFSLASPDALDLSLTKLLDVTLESFKGLPTDPSAINSVQQVLMNVMTAAASRIVVDGYADTELDPHFTSIYARPRLSDLPFTASRVWFGPVSSALLSDACLDLRVAVLRLNGSALILPPAAVQLESVSDSVVVGVWSCDMVPLFYGKQEIRVAVNANTNVNLTSLASQQLLGCALQDWRSGQTYYNISGVISIASDGHSATCGVSAPGVVSLVKRVIIPPSPAPSVGPSPGYNPHHPSGLGTGAIVGIVVGIVVVILIAVVAVICVHRRRRHQGTEGQRLPQGKDDSTYASLPA